MIFISQVDLLQYGLTVLAVILGFFSASIANVFKDYVERRRLRNAIYNEVAVMYESILWCLRQLQVIINTGGRDIDPPHAFNTYYSLLMAQLKGDSYTYAKTTTPTLFNGIAEAKAIDFAYLAYGMLSSHYKSLESASASDPDPLIKIKNLKSSCEAALQSLESPLRELDGKKLLKACSSSENRETLKKLLKMTN